ncbi:AraC family transcriptional regulator [Cardiobacteriaceae bacterium TAE3-ERU3]|nr:AraC family transcriptional regulator [Cardiobacteriaceae bacterium TAE3-ERU3]
MSRQRHNHYDPTHWQTEQTDANITTVKPLLRGWSGFGDHHLMDNGALLSRVNINTSNAAREPAIPFSCHFSLHIAVEADYTFYSSAVGKNIDVHNRSIWCCRGDLGDITASWQRNSRNRAISLYFPAVLLERWHEQSALPKWLQRGSSAPLEPLPQLTCHPRAMARAAQIIAQPATTLFDRLRLESLYLNLCGELFAADQCRNSNKIDDVIDIIHSEYHGHLTISALAVRVGLNECYLKHQFKQRTGSTIAAYVRELRMREAMRLLLDEGKTLQETAWYVGYRDSGYFSRVFRTTYGFSPTDIT